MKIATFRVYIAAGILAISGASGARAQGTISTIAGDGIAGVIFYRQGDYREDSGNREKDNAE